jgi:putative Mg2+ transporter-C (MgtC) family protein
LETGLRLLTAAFLASLIGFERELRAHPAGLKTHILVANGACLLSMVSVMVAGGQSDPGRISAAVVTGIGFIGAGAILRQGIGVQGLTTAATLWVAAAVGVVAGAGWYEGAGMATVVTLVTLLLVQWLEDRTSKAAVSLVLTCWPVGGLREALEAMTVRHGGDPARLVQIDDEPLGGLRFVATVMGRHAAHKLVGELADLPFVAGVATTRSTAKGSPAPKA